jgi:hypothetical protein
MYDYKLQQFAPDGQGRPIARSTEASGVYRLDMQQRFSRSRMDVNFKKSIIQKSAT